MAPEIVIRVKASRADVRAAIRSIPAVLAGRAPDPTGAARSVQLVAGQVAVSLIRDAYITKARGGTDAAGEKWAPLAPATLRRKRGRNPEILRDKGILLNSLSPGVAVSLGKPGEVIVGTNVPHAKYHMTGTKRMPQRRLWPEPKKWPSAWWSQIGAKVNQAIVILVRKMLGAP